MGNRIIKFRAWDGEKMVDNICVAGNGNLTTWDETDDTFSLRLKNVSWPLMQLTGLHDKNGIEIYEGDIIEWSTETGGVWDRKQKGVVVFNRGRFECFLALHEMASIEIIGNIHQTPDLL